MVKQSTEQDLREQLLKGKLSPETNARHARIYRAVTSIVGCGSVYYVLTDTPEQFTDVFRVLVDDKVVVGFELERKNPDAPPTDIEQYSVEDYRKASRGGISGATLRIALELAKQDLRCH